MWRFFFSMAMIVASIMSASASGDFVTDVAPPQGRLSASEAYPLGMKQIMISFATEVQINDDCEESIRVYRDEEADPIEMLHPSSVILDEMTRRMAALLFTGDFTDPGRYRVEIPAGLWINSRGEENASLSLEYQIVREWSVEPVDHAVLSSVSHWDFTADAADKLSLNGKQSKMRIDIPTGQKFCDAKVTSIESNRMTIAPTDDLGRETIIEKEGSYILFIPRNTLKYTYYGAHYPADINDISEATNGDDLRIHITITNIPRPSISPKEGEIKAFGDFVLTLSDECELISASSSKEVLLLTAEGSYISENAYLRYRVSEDGVNPMKREIRLSPVISDDEALSKASDPLPGQYVLRLSRDMMHLVYDGAAIGNAPFDYRFSVASTPAAYSVTPESGSETAAIDIIDISFERESHLIGNPDEISIFNDKGERIAAVFAISKEGSLFRLSLQKSITDAGVYRLTIPAGMFESRGTPSPEIRLQYTVDGSLSLFIPEEGRKYTVYSTDGVLLMRDAATETVKQLPRGIYVINSRKVRL